MKFLPAVVVPSSMHAVMNRRPLVRQSQAEEAARWCIRAHSLAADVLDTEGIGAPLRRLGHRRGPSPKYAISTADSVQFHAVANMGSFAITHAKGHGGQHVAVSRTIGLDMPDDFPATDYDALAECMRGLFRSGAHPEQSRMFSDSWNAVGYRFRSMCDASDAFAQSYAAFGSGPPFRNAISKNVPFSSS